MEKQKVAAGWCKAAVACGVLATIIALLPLLSGWCMILLFANWVLVPLGVVFAIVAIVKKQSLVKTIVGLVLCAFAAAAPWILKEPYAKAAAKSVENAAETVGNMVKATGAEVDYSDLGDSDYEW